jgi:hypothetical protein
MVLPDGADKVSARKQCFKWLRLYLAAAARVSALAGSWCTACSVVRNMVSPDNCSVAQLFHVESTGNLPELGGGEWHVFVMTFAQSNSVKTGAIFGAFTCGATRRTMKLRVSRLVTRCRPQERGGALCARPSTGARMCGQCWDARLRARTVLPHTS